MGDLIHIGDNIARAMSDWNEQRQADALWTRRRLLRLVRQREEAGEAPPFYARPDETASHGEGRTAQG